MVVYPLHVPRKGYRGSKLGILQEVTHRNKFAMELEDYLNARIRERDESVQTCLYYAIARDLNPPIDDVRDTLFAVDGGHNGLTVTNAGARAVEAFY